MKFFYKNPNDDRCYELQPDPLGEEKLSFVPFRSNLHGTIEIKGSSRSLQKGNTKTDDQLTTVEDYFDSYRECLKRAIDDCIANKLDKVVVSRAIKLSGQLNHEGLFFELVRLHSNCFVYLLEYDDVMYIGATPEKLVEIEGVNVKSVALAGTMPVSIGKELSNWKSKEKAEQKLVLDFVQEVFERYCVKLSIGDLKTILNGPVAHLINQVEGVLENLEDSSKLIADLHPTPAVCGTPKQKAFNWINSNESYDREYYTGYIALSTKTKSNCYVNLRCLKAENDEVSIYVGGGITKDSILDKEFKETELKSRVLLDAIAAVQRLNE